MIYLRYNQRDSREQLLTRERRRLTEKYTFWRVIHRRVFGQLTGTVLIHSSQVTSNRTGYQKQRLMQNKKREKKQLTGNLSTPIKKLLFELQIFIYTTQSTEKHLPVLKEVLNIYIFKIIHCLSSCSTLEVLTLARVKSKSHLFPQ